MVECHLHAVVDVGVGTGGNGDLGESFFWGDNGDGGERSVETGVGDDTGSEKLFGVGGDKSNSGSTTVIFFV